MGVESQTTAQKTVTIACKIPMGIVMQEFRMMDEREQTPNGVRDIKVARPTGKAAIINGNATAPNKMRFDANGRPVHITAGGYAFTPNVDADLWENWREHYKDHPWIKNRMVFAVAKPHEAEAISRENEARRSNLEPMNPAGDPRAPNRRSLIGEGRVVSEISTATGRDA